MIKTVGNDLNTAMAITLLYNVLKEKTSGNTKRALIEMIDSVLALSLLEKADEKRLEAENAAKAAAEAAAKAHEGDPEAAEIEALIAERAAAKKEKNFARADEIRAELTARGITITDTAQGTTWTR